MTCVFVCLTKFRVQADGCVSSTQLLWHKISLISCIKFTSKWNVALIVSEQGDWRRRSVWICWLRTIATYKKFAGIIVGRFQVTSTCICIWNILVWLLMYHRRWLWRWSMIVIIVWWMKCCGWHSRIRIRTKRCTWWGWCTRYDRLIRTRRYQCISCKVWLRNNTHIFYFIYLQRWCHTHKHTHAHKTFLNCDCISNESVTCCCFACCALEHTVHFKSIDFIQNTFSLMSFIYGLNRCFSHQDWHASYFF